MKGWRLCHPLFMRFHLPLVLALTFAARLWEMRR